MSSLGLYVPGDSLAHRLPAGVKLGGLLAAGVGSLWLDTWPLVASALAVVLALYPLAHVPACVLWRQVRPLGWVLTLVAVFHLLASGWERTAVVVGLLLCLVLLASWVTLTTRTSDLLEFLVAACGPLRRVGVDPDRVGLLVALGIRSVPVSIDLAQQVRDAQLARGLQASPRAFAVPLVVRALRRADAVAEALVARGVEDPHPARGSSAG